MNKPTYQLLPRKIYECVHCDNLLKGPVMLVQNRGNICFSCYEDLRDSNDYAFALENTPLNMILEQIEIPCTYKDEGCDKTLKPTHLKTHEDDCFYQTFKCIFAPNCPWTVCLREVVSHCKNYHEDKVLRDKNDCYKFSVKDVRDDAYLLETSIGYFLLYMRKSMGYLKILICDDTQPKEELECNFDVIFASNRVNKIIRRCKSIEDLKSFFTFDDSKSTNIPLDSINECVMAVMNELGPVLNIEMNIKLINGEDSSLNDAIIELIRCTGCSCYIQSIIHSCTNGHTYCQNCTTYENGECPECEVRTFQDRKLDELANLISRLPCRYEEKGCMRKIYRDSMHEKICNYSTWECFGENCYFESTYPGIVSHVKSTHQVFGGFGELSGLQLKYKLYEDGFYNIIENNILFQLLFQSYAAQKTVSDNEGQSTRVEVDEFRWALSIIRQYNTQPYVFEIEISFGNTNLVREMILRSYTEASNEAFITVTSDILKEICPNTNCFDYKVRVFRETPFC